MTNGYIKNILSTLVNGITYEGVINREITTQNFHEDNNIWKSQSTKTFTVDTRLDVNKEYEIEWGRNNSLPLQEFDSGFSCLIVFAYDLDPSNNRTLLMKPFIHNLTMKEKDDKQVVFEYNNYSSTDENVSAPTIEFYKAFWI